jgi:hypothetical protein
MHTPDPSALLTEAVTRKEFLIKAGILLLTCTGIAALLRATVMPQLPRLTSARRQGFGGGAYGG